MDYNLLKRAFLDNVPMFGWLGGLLAYLGGLFLLCFYVFDPLSTSLLVFAALDLASAVVGVTYLSYRSLAKEEEIRRRRE